MEKQFRFTSELFRIVEGALRLDVEKVRNYSYFLAEKLAAEGDESSAKRLRKMIEASVHQLHPVDAVFAKSLPVDSESRFPLIERFNLKGIVEPPLIISQNQWDVLNEFLSIAEGAPRFESHGMAESISLLIYGPPGTGKNRLVRYIAEKLGRELYTARLDGLISSFLGSTAKNIRALFEFASRNPCILFLDEFDAIAKLRGDNQELGELKRVVNSFIQNLDSLGPHSIIVAATNHEGLLDSAVWRRFSYRIELGYPSTDQRVQLWDGFLPLELFSKKEIAALVDLSEGYTGSDIREVCLRLIRRGLVTHIPPMLSDAFQILQNVTVGEGKGRKFLANMNGCDHRGIAHSLRARDDKLYSVAMIASILGISRSAAHRLISKE